MVPPFVFGGPSFTKQGALRCALCGEALHPEVESSGGGQLYRCFTSGCPQSGLVLMPPQIGSIYWQEQVATSERWYIEHSDEVEKLANVEAQFVLMERGEITAFACPYCGGVSAEGEAFCCPLMMKAVAAIFDQLLIRLFRLAATVGTTVLRSTAKD